MKKVLPIILALTLLLSACGGGGEADAVPSVQYAQVGNLSGTFSKPPGCNDPCQSISAVFVTTDENLISLNPQCFINWGDNSLEEQFMAGTHTYPLGAPRSYDVTLRCDVKNGDATMSTVLKVAVTVPFEVPQAEAPLEEDVPLEEP